MTDPLFTPLKSHPSTWPAEVEQIKAKLAEAESAVEWADVRATQAVEEARELREQLAAERNANGHEKRLRQEVIELHQQSEAESKALRKRVVRLEEALLWYEPLLTDFSQETNHRADCAEELLDRDGGKRARVALQEGKG